MTNTNDLRKLAEAILQYPADYDAIKTDGLYGGGPNPSEGYNEYEVYDQNGNIIFSTENWEGGTIEDDYENPAYNFNSRAFLDYALAANPTAILELIADIDALTAERDALREKAKRLCDAADAVGCAHFDTDSWSDEVKEMSEATLDLRAALQEKDNG